MPSIILETPGKLQSTTTSVAVVGGGGGLADDDDDAEFHDESCSLLINNNNNNNNRSNSYSSTYEVEINELKFTRSRVEHDSYYLNPTPHKERHLGIISVSLMIVSKMFGSGIFATPAIIYKKVDGSPILFFTCWLIALVVAFGGMRIYLELSTLIDKNGGTKTYLQFLYYKPKMMMNCITSILTVLFGFVITNSIIFAKYSIAFVDIDTDDDNNVLVNYLALLLITFGTVLYGISIRHAVILQNYIGIVKFFLLFVMTCSSIYVLLPSTLTGLTYNQNLKFDHTFWEINFANQSMANFASLSLKATFAMGGYQSISVFTGEVINPQRTLKLACPYSLLVVGGSFVIINFAYLSAISRDELMQSDELVGALLFSKIFGTSIGTKFLTLSVAISCLGNVLISIYGIGLVNQEAFREGFLPFSQIMASNWPKNAPLPALLVSFILSFIILVFPPSDDIYDFIINLDSYPSNFFGLLVGLGIFIIRWKYSYLKSSVKAPLWSTLAYCAVMVFLMVSPLIGDGGDKLYAYCGITCLASGVVYWFVYFKLLPRLFRYDLVETEIALDGGMTVKKWERLYY